MNSPFISLFYPILQEAQYHLYYFMEAQRAIKDLERSI